MKQVRKVILTSEATGQQDENRPAEVRAHGHLSGTSRSLNDLIILGNKGFNKRERLLLGSVSTAVAKAQVEKELLL